MSKTTHDTRASIWRRLFIERSDASEFIADPRPVFLVCSVIALVAGIVGWIMASTYPGWLVPTCSIVGILSGVLGVRSKLRSLALIGFVMGMFLFPRAILTLIRMLAS